LKDSLSLFVFTVLIFTLFSFVIQDVFASTDQFGINQLYPNAPGGRTWYNHWNNTAPHDIAAGSTDPNDPLFHATGIGYTHVFGNGSAYVNGTAPRMYVYDSTLQQLWNNVEITIYGKRVSESAHTSYAGLTAFGRSGSHDTATYPNVCTDSIGYPNSAENARLTFDGKADFRKEILYHVGDAVSNDGSDSSPIIKPAWVNFTNPIVLMNDSSGKVGFVMYGTNRNTYAEFVSPTSILIGKSMDDIQIKLKKTGSPTGLAYVGIFNVANSLTKQFGTIDVSTLEARYRNYEFKNNANVTINSGDYIGIKYSGGDANNNVAVMTDQKNTFDDTNSYLSTYMEGWTDTLTNDMHMILTSGGEETPVDPSTGYHTMPYGKYIGLKVIIRTLADNSTVNIQTWEDMSNGKNGGSWALMNQYNDSGNWASDPNFVSFFPGWSSSNWPCPTVSYNYRELHAMPYVGIRADYVNELDYKWFSIREIAPLVSSQPTSQSLLEISENQNIMLNWIKPSSNNELYRYLLHMFQG
jgi:hypothetical protein